MNRLLDNVLGDRFLRAVVRVFAVTALVLLVYNTARSAPLEVSRRNQQIARNVLADRGWGHGRQWGCLRVLWRRESGWDHRARNPRSGAFGIPQALPASRMRSAGPDWRWNPVTQVRWGASYITSMYGTPCRALAHSDRLGWY